MCCWSEERCAAVVTGRIVRFDDVRGYGFIAPDDGGEDVFVHANVLSDEKHVYSPGVPVEFEVVDSDRGPKALSARVLRTGASTLVGRQAVATSTPGATPSDEAQERAAVPPRTPTPAGAVARMAVGADNEDGLCDVLAERVLVQEVTERLLAKLPDLTGAQIVAVREQVLALARDHGWVEN
jgi:cold shock CspA family protein